MSATNPISTLNVSLSATALIQQAIGAAGILGSPTVTPSSFTQPGVSQNFQNLSTLPSNVQFADQVLYEKLTIASSGTTTKDLSASFTNVIGVSGATFGTGISGIIWFLPTVAQAANYGITITVQATSITIGNTASTQFLGPLGSNASELTLYPGDISLNMRTGSTPWTVSSTAKSLLITNNDSTNAATLIGFYVGT